MRRSNEDSHLIASPLFVVADGMGGANAGEVASALAVEVLTRTERADRSRRSAASRWPFTNVPLVEPEVLEVDVVTAPEHARVAS